AEQRGSSVPSRLSSPRPLRHCRGLPTSVATTRVCSRGREPIYFIGLSLLLLGRLGGPIEIFDLYMVRDEGPVHRSTKFRAVRRVSTDTRPYHHGLLSEEIRHQQVGGLSCLAKHEQLRAR